MLGPIMANRRRFMIGDFEVTTILGGTVPRDNPQGIFGMNVSEEEFAAVSAQNFLSTDASRFFFTPFLGRTPSLSDYLGESIRGRVHEIIIDLPAGLPVLRKLMNHGRTDALLRISHVAGTVSVHTDAQPKFLFGFEILASAFVF